MPPLFGELFIMVAKQKPYIYRNYQIYTYLFKKIRCAAYSDFATLEDLEDLSRGGLFGWHIFCRQAWAFVNMTPDFAGRHGVS